MNKKSILLAIILSLSLSLVVSAEESSATTSTSTTGTTSTSNTSAPDGTKADDAEKLRQLEDKNYQNLMKDYNPQSYYDYKMRVKQVSFDKRFAWDGKGEVLNVHFDIENFDVKENKYTFYVLAVNEKNNVNPKSMSLTNNLAWKPQDPKKNMNEILYAQLSPKNIDTKLIYGEELNTYKTNYISTKRENGDSINVTDPNFQTYVAYLSKNSKDGQVFSLFGDEGPKPGKEYETNYKAVNDEEYKSDVLKTVPDHTYSIYYKKRATTIMTHHYSRYRSDFYAFNKVAILIFDNSKKSNPLVYRSIHDISHVKVKSK